jgi:hypothetical protein
MTALGHYQPLSVSLGEWLESAKSGHRKPRLDGGVSHERYYAYQEQVTLELSTFALSSPFAFTVT